MSWDQAPPEKHELGNWFDAPPTKEEMEAPAHPFVSGVRTLAQEASGRFSDELAGAVEGVGRVLGVSGAGGPMKDIEIAEDGPTLDWEIIKDAYKRARDKERASLKKDMSDNPRASITGSIAGAVMSPLNKVVPTASLMKSGAILGGVGGLGGSESETLGGMALDTAAGTAIGGTVGAGFDKASSVIRRGAGALKGKFADASNKLAKTPVENLDEVLAASQRLGVKPIEAMKTSNPSYQKLESGLSQSGSFPAMSVREDYNNLFKGLEKAGGKISDLKSVDSDFNLGQGIKAELAEQIAKARAPVSEMYDNIHPDLKQIPVNESIVNRVLGSLKRDPIFQNAQGREFLDEYRQNIMQNPDLSSLKEFRSTLKSMVNENSLPIDQMRVEAMRKAVTSIRDNSIEAMKADLPKHMHGEVDDLIGRIALADSAHASNIKDINSIKGLVGNKDFGSPTTFLNKLGGAKEADLATRAGNLDIQSLRNMQEKFPAIFEKARTAKVNEMLQKASPGGEFRESTFFRQYDGLDQELKDLLFDKNMQQHISDLQAVRQSIPDKLGPSGTPEGLMSMDMFNPKRNIYDFLIKKSLDHSGAGQNILKKASESAGAINKGLAPGGSLNQGQRAPLQLVPRTFESSPAQFPRAAEKNDSASFNDTHNKDALIQKAQGTKYQQVLQNAAQNGEQSFSAAHYVLSQRDPEYRKTIGQGD